MEIHANKCAILGLNLSLELGQSWKPVTIFKDLSIKVPKGAIYGLIGPSGCGKTTLQRCIFGFYRPTKGTLLVFGRSPLEKGFGVPGPLVGFMPQDLALNEDLTIKEMLTFFGRLSDLPMDIVNERIDELLKVIDIPYPDRLISNLSIGQRRRISLAASLIHRPKLLLLDEPTVGSDPLLVYKMWTYLFHLRDTYKMTIVVTTHYLEEIVKADRFGLMRKGQIIVEDNPMSFMKKYKETSLEKAVFRLCTEWDSRKKPSTPSSSSSNSPKLSLSIETNGMVQKKTSTQQSTLDGQNTQIYNAQSPSSSFSSSSILPSDPPSLTSSSSSSSLAESWTPLSNFTVLIILMWRLWLRCQRFMIYPIILSCLIIFIITLTFGVMFGRFPKDLRVNYMDLGTNDRNITIPFLSFLSENSIILERVNSELESRLKLEKGLIDGYFIIGENFEESIREKIEKGLSSLSHHVQNHLFGPKVKDKIFLTIDASNQFKFDTLVITISRSLTKLMHETQTNLNVTNNYYQFFTVTPIYESYEPDNLMASNENVLIRYFCYAIEQFTIILMMSWTIKEAHERMNERLMAAGISRIQLTMALIVTSTLVIVPIYLIFFTLLIPTLNFPMRGSWIAVVLSIIAITVCGISKGIFIGLLSNDLIMAAFLHSAYCFSSLFLGYLLWPYESLPDFIKPLTYWFPFALSGDSLVWSLMKGKAFTDVLVYQNIVYSIIFAIVSIILVLVGFNKW